jgi:hypothetical protein
MMVNSLNKRTNFEYGYRPSVLPTKSYPEFVQVEPDQFLNNATPKKHSEFKQPYLSSTSYQLMDYWNQIGGSKCGGGAKPVTQLCDISDPRAEGTAVHLGVTYGFYTICDPTGYLESIPVIPAATATSGECAGETIGYTSLLMATSGSQTLNVVSPVSGVTYSWTTSSGSIDEEGETVTYTAPSSNADCTNNPTITLLVNGNACDSLQLSVNGGSGVAYYEWSRGTCDGDFLCYGYLQQWECNDFTTGSGEWIWVGSDCADCYYGLENIQPGTLYSCNGVVLVVGFHDCRTAGQLAAGCCPSGLL